LDLCAISRLEGWTLPSANRALGRNFTHGN